MKNAHHLSCPGLAVILMLAPIAGNAQDKNQFRDEAKAAEEQLRALGEPKDRCSIGAFVADGAIVTRATETSTLMSGDRLILVNGIKTAGAPGNDVIAILRGTEPAAVIPVTLDRRGELIDIEVSCENAREFSEAQLNVLSLAGRAKFDECVAAVDQRSDFGTFGAFLKAQCASFARSARKYDVPRLSLEAMRMAIEDAHWAPSMRADVVQRLRNVEGLIASQLGSAPFTELIAATRAWPGGKDMYEASEPDWSLFRRNSESALRARLIDPASAQIEWPYGFLLGSWRPVFSKRIDGYWTCGTVNARNRMGGYTGRTSFVVVLDPGGSVVYADIGEASDFDVVTSQCSNSVKLLPPRPTELSANAASQPPTASSIADELKKLLDLKNSGALTEAEFEAAKARVLEGQR